MRRLSLDQFVAAGQWCHYASPRIAMDDYNIPHTHDFHEVFWIETGQGLHHVNGIEQPLRPGTAVLIAAPDAHGFETAPDESFQLVNIAFHASTWNDLRNRYFAGDHTDDDPAALIDLPVEQRMFALSDADLQLLRSHASEIAGGARSRMAIDRFLLNLLHLLRSSTKPPGGEPRWPGWLARACRQIAEQRHFVGGTRELARLAGKSPEHLARELRRVCGKTPTEIVNDARMTYAAARLATTNDEILDIALDCGLENLGHFYQLFRNRYGMTPRKYRLREQRIVRPML